MLKNANKHKKGKRFMLSARPTAATLQLHPPSGNPPDLAQKILFWSFLSGLETETLGQACFLHAFPAIYATGVAGNLSLEAESLSFFQSELSFFLSDLSFDTAPSFSHKGRVFSGAFTLAVYAALYALGPNQHCQEKMS